MSLFLLTVIFSAKAVNITMTEKEFESLYSNIESQGVKIVKIPGKGNGIIVEKKFEEGDPVLCVDEFLGIFPMDQYELSKLVEGLGDLISLKIRLLYEKFMAPRGNYLTEYVHSLPATIHHYGDWTEYQRNYFKRLSLEPVNETELLEIEEFKFIVDLLKGVKDVPEEMLTYSTFMWASFQVKSRYFFCYKENGEKYDCLYPVLDLVNFGQLHYFTPVETEVINGKNCLFASKTLMPGDEFLNDYAVHRAPLYLLDFSMIDDTYEYDCLEFSFNGKIFLLYAHRLSTELLEEIIGESLQSITTEKIKKVLRGLKEYRKLFTEYFTGPGIRELRREHDMLEDKLLELINRFGVSIRTTFYNHLEKIDIEHIRTLWSLHSN